MTAIENIIQAILDEAENDAEEVVGAARAKANDIAERAKSEAQAEGAKITDDADRRVSEIEHAHESAVGLRRRQAILQAKQELLGETLELALQRLYELPDDQYFSLLITQASLHAENGEGQMLLNRKDNDRLPADFAGRLAKALPSGGSISLSKETRPIDGGFVLRYGNIEVNCSFEALFDARREELFDRIRDILFAG